MRFAKSHAGSGHNASGNFELNITPIIDCFTVLIAFVLVATSVASINIMESQVSAPAGAALLQDPKSSVTISVHADRSIDIQLVAGARESAAVRERFKKGVKIAPNPKGIEPDYNLLLQRLAFIKGEWPQLKNAVIVADNAVLYQDVVKSMAMARNAFASVALGGFEGEK